MMPQTEGNLFALVPLLLFMALMLAIGVWVRRGRGFGEDFV